MTIEIGLVYVDIHWNDNRCVAGIGYWRRSSWIYVNATDEYDGMTYRSIRLGPFYYCRRS